MKMYLNKNIGVYKYNGKKNNKIIKSKIPTLHPIFFTNVKYIINNAISINITLQQ